jgi:hypothetical protein
MLPRQSADFLGFFLLKGGSQSADFSPQQTKVCIPIFEWTPNKYLTRNAHTQGPLC